MSKPKHIEAKQASRRTATQPNPAAGAAIGIVRCKDCTQWGGVTFGNVCRRWSAPLAGMKNCTGPDDYCSYGERKSENP